MEKIVYEILSNRDTETGLLYRAWKVPEGFPLEHNFITEEIPSDLIKARYDYRLESWIEDTELIEKSKVEKLEKELAESSERVDVLENAVLDLLLMEMRNE